MGQLLGLSEGVIDIEGSFSANGSRVPVKQEQIRLRQSYLKSRSLKRSYGKYDEHMIKLLFCSTAIEEDKNAGIYRGGGDAEDGAERPAKKGDEQSMSECTLTQRRDCD